MIESRLWHLRSEVGLVFTKPFYKHFNVYLSPQFVLEFIDMSVQRVETLTFTPAASYPTDTLEAHTESAHELTVEPGFLLTAGIDYRINEQWYAGVSLGWEWLFDRPSICIGSQSVQFDLDGGEFSLYLGRSL